MGEIKKRFLGLSEWVTFELETDAIDPPVLRLRMRPVQVMGVFDAIAGGSGPHTYRDYMTSVAVEAVQEWDLADAGAPIPPTEENKRLYLVEQGFLGLRVRGEDVALGMAIIKYAGTRDNFLKN